MNLGYQYSILSDIAGASSSGDVDILMAVDSYTSESKEAHEVCLQRIVVLYIIYLAHKYIDIFIASVCLTSPAHSC
jgi:hypothetical protein